MAKIYRMPHLLLALICCVMIDRVSSQSTLDGTLNAGPSNQTTLSPAPTPFGQEEDFFRSLFGRSQPNVLPPPTYLGTGLCLSSDTITPFVLSDKYTCPLHFYCPNVNTTDPLSLPSMCPPTLQCQILRLSTLICPAQGKYEPTVCDRGFYCPDYLTQLQCPVNHFCPLGTVDPIPCTMPFSVCPVQSYKQQYYGGAIVCGIFDVAFILFYSFSRLHNFLQDRKKIREESRRVSARRHGTIASTPTFGSKKERSHKEANFITYGEDFGDNDSEDSTPVPTGISMFTKRFWKKLAAKSWNGLFYYVPMSWQSRPSRIPKVGKRKKNKGKQSCSEITSPAIHNLNLKRDESQLEHGIIDEDHTNVYMRKSTPCSITTLHDTHAGDSTPDSESPVCVTSNSHTIHFDESVKVQSGTIESDFPHPRHSLHLNALLRGFRKAQNDQDLSLRFKFEDLGLTLPSGKLILNGVTGEIVPGKVTVIMGPSGAGKSTFMNVLMGKLARTGGRLMINDREVEMYHFKKIIGYVPQDDVMLHELTVRENIAYSAHTRLPRSWSTKEIESFIDVILEALDLTHVAGNMINAVSGGQRKRVNIGMELVTCPSAMFLDEPTSGLDATAALKVANTMKKIAMSIGITIVSVIHQPRYEIFEEFDDLLMIAPGGVTAYLGDKSKAQQHFQNLGFYFDPRNNPADTLMDILSGKGVRGAIGDIDSLTSHNGEFEDVTHERLKKLADVNQTVEYDVVDLVAVWKKRETYLLAQDLMRHPVLPVLGPVEPLPPLPQDSDNSVNSLGAHSYLTNTNVDLPGTPTISDNALYAAMSDNTYYAPNTIDSIKSKRSDSEKTRDVTLQLDDNDGTMLSRSSVASKKELDLQHSTLRRACLERGASWVAQIVFSHNRSMVQQWRKINAFALEILVAIVAGSVMGLAMTAYDGSLYQGLFVRPFTLISPAPVELVVPILALIIGCAVGLAGAPAGSKIFSEEKEVYWREASAGHSPFAYFLGKNISTIYRIAVCSLHFSACFHMFACPNIMFWKLYTIQLFQFFCIYGVAFVVAMLVKRENASMVAVCICVVFAVLCGNGPSLKNAREWGIGWLLDISYNRWAAEAWYSEELMVFDGVYEIWDISAAHFGFTLDRFWMDIFWMFMIGLAARVVAFILLVLLNRQRQR